MEAVREQIEHHYVNDRGHYLGMLIGYRVVQGRMVLEEYFPTPIAPNAVEVDSAPPDPSYIWTGTEWQAP